MPVVDVQLRGFPYWLEEDDIRCTVDQCGVPAIAMDLKWDANGVPSIAEASMPTWASAEAVVAQLHKHEITPGYPLQARIKPGQTPPPSSGKGAKSAAQKGGKGPAANALAKVELPDLPPADPENSVQNCLDAGRIEGWFLQGRSQVEQKRWGHVQSFSFEGNLLFRPANSPTLKEVYFNQKDPVYFEVVMIKGQCEAVRLKTPEMEGQEEDGEATVKAEQPSRKGDGKNKRKRDEYYGGEYQQEASWKSKQRREQENQDGTWVFIGGFGREISEDTLRGFAEQVGTVKKIKIFMDTQTWISKGCGKVEYSDPEEAEKAVNELAGTVLNERIVSVERLGASREETQRPAARQQQRQAARQDVTDEVPKQLPLSLFADTDDPDAKLQICYAAFEHVLYGHDPVATGLSLILMIRKIIGEVNDVFGDDEVSLKKFVAHMRSYRWFWENQQVVKWQASKRRINISKLTGAASQHIQIANERMHAIEQRKADQKLVGKAIFEVPEAERLPPAQPLAWGKQFFFP